MKKIPKIPNQLGLKIAHSRLNNKNRKFEGAKIMILISKHLERLFNICCESESTVLMSGQTGTGKSTLAKLIHDRSSRVSNPFVTVNLATLHEGLLESELFGHEKGAFTGADQKRIGRIELAQNGTLFLDEVGDLPLRLQARLLEFLQSKIVTPVGSNREVQLNVRVLAATHKNLSVEMKQGRFRSDLFHRLRILELPLLSLKERSDEFDEIFHICLNEVCKRLNKKILRIHPLVAEKLESYAWPGNIRELINTLEYAVLTSEKNEIRLVDLPQWILSEEELGNHSQIDESDAALGVAELKFSLDYYKTLSAFESEYLRRALCKHGGRISHTARKIGLNKTTLQRKIALYSLK